MGKSFLRYKYNKVNVISEILNTNESYFKKKKEEIQMERSIIFDIIHIWWKNSDTGDIDNWMKDTL